MTKVQRQCRQGQVRQPPQRRWWMLQNQMKPFKSISEYKGKQEALDNHIFYKYLCSSCPEKLTT